ncbi:hypothetical protein Tco_1419609 [Tanacetum coccineum]
MVNLCKIESGKDMNLNSVKLERIDGNILGVVYVFVEDDNFKKLLDPFDDAANRHLPADGTAAENTGSRSTRIKEIDQKLQKAIASPNQRRDLLQALFAEVALQVDDRARGTKTILILHFWNVYWQFEALRGLFDVIAEFICPRNSLADGGFTIPCLACRMQSL